MGILIFIAMFSCMTGYAYTDLERTGTKGFALTAFLSVLIIVAFARYLVAYGVFGLFLFVSTAICVLAV